MKKIIATCICLVTIFVACDYEETQELNSVSVQLVYPSNTIEPYAGARVELTDANRSTFVDSTDAAGVAHFNVPSGLYEIMSSGIHLTYDYRYIYNGVKSQVVISPDSTNNINLQLTVSKKRIVH